MGHGGVYIRKKSMIYKAWQLDRQTCFCASVDSTGYLLGHVTVLHETNS